MTCILAYMCNVLSGGGSFFHVELCQFFFFLYFFVNFRFGSKNEITQLKNFQEVYMQFIIQNTIIFTLEPLLLIPGRRLDNFAISLIKFCQNNINTESWLPKAVMSLQLKFFLFSFLSVSITLLKIRN